MSVCTSAAKPASSSVTAPTIPPDAELPASSGTGRRCGRSGRHPRLPLLRRGSARRQASGPPSRRQKPCLQRQLRRFTDRTAQQHQRRPHQHVIAVSKVRWCQFHHFAEVQGAQFVVKNEQRESEEHVTHGSRRTLSLPLRHSSDRCNRNRSAEEHRPRLPSRGTSTVGYRREPELPCWR